MRKDKILYVAIYGTLTVCELFHNINIENTEQRCRCRGVSVGVWAYRNTPIHLPILYICRMDDFKQTDEPQSGETIAVIVTNRGLMKLRLFPEIVGAAAENFIELARQGKYDGAPFHRVIKDFMIQGGDFTNKNGTGGHAAQGEDSTISDVYDPRLTHIHGALSWAKTAAPNSIGSQFFIVHGKDGAHFLDHPADGHEHQGYTVFGQLYEGFETLDNIATVKTDSRDRPKEDIIIRSISIENV